MKADRLRRIDILRYALEGAYTIRGTQSGNMSDEEENQLESDIEKLKKLIATAEAKEKTE